VNEKSKAILAGFTGRKKRSQLAPYRDLICKLHQRGCAFREIVHILSENFSLTVAHTTVIRFVARLEQETSKLQKLKPRKERPVQIIPTTTMKPIPPHVASYDEIRQKIAAFKKQVAQTEPHTKRFEYDPDQPLHLFREDEKV